MTLTLWKGGAKVIVDRNSEMEHKWRAKGYLERVEAPILVRTGGAPLKSAKKAAAPVREAPAPEAVAASAVATSAEAASAEAADADAALDAEIDDLSVDLPPEAEPQPETSSGKIPMRHVGRGKKG